MELLVGFHHYLSNESVDGKILLFWNEHISIQPWRFSTQCLSVSANYGGQSFIISIIYAKCSRSERLPLWDELKDYHRHMDKPWILAGDFNVVGEVNEKLGGRSPDLNAINDFRDMISFCGLIDGGYTGSKYTW